MAALTSPLYLKGGSRVGYKILWDQILIVFLIVLLTTWAATHWTAYRLGFQPQLGPAWFELGGWPNSPKVFVEGAYIAASGGFITIAVAIGMSVWRAREAKNVETYGSARWARPDEIGPNNSVLDNCHVRVSFATNDERTAKRVSDALGTATEMKAMKNYAGHRLSPWLGHLMVSRSETARPLLTPGEIMQLPPADEIVMVAGTPPIRAKKTRYFEDRRFQERILPPPALSTSDQGSADDWSKLSLPASQQLPAAATPTSSDDEDTTESERRRQPELNRIQSIEKTAPIENEFELDPVDDGDDDVARNSQLRDTMRQAALDPRDGIEL